jgi:hypothetical protein
MNDLTKFTDPAARTPIFQAADLNARLLLISLAEELVARREHAAAALLIHAELYLADRSSYAIAPPSHRLAMPADC